MNRTPAGVVDEPRLDAGAVEAAQALEPGHGDAGLELLEADGALGVVDAVLLGGRVGEDAGAPCGPRWRGAMRARGAPVVRTRTRTTPAPGPAPTAGTRAVGAVLRDAVVDVGFAAGLEVRELARGELVVADGALVFFGDLRGRGRQGPVDGRVPGGGHR